MQLLTIRLLSHMILSFNKPIAIHTVNIPGTLSMNFKSKHLCDTVFCSMSIRATSKTYGNHN